jgi:putative transposase
MKRKQFSEEQIIGILKEAEAGAVVTELCRKHGMSSATYYAWKAKFGGLEVSDAKRCQRRSNFLPLWRNKSRPAVEAR